MAHPYLEVLRNHIASGGDGDLAAHYHPDATLDAYLPGRIVHSQGPDTIAETLASWHSGLSQVLDWNINEFDETGITVDVEWRSQHDGRQRRTHWLHLADQKITRHLVFPARPTARTIPSGEPGPALASVYAAAIERTVITAGISGSAMERVRTSAGETLFVKWLTPAEDWQMRATDDRGREAQLCSGHLDRLPAGVTHPVVAAEPYGPDRWTVISRDLRQHLAPRPLSLALMRRQLAALRDLHQTFRGTPPDGLATIEQRWSLFWPTTPERERDGCDAMPKAIARGWDLLDSMVDAETAAVVRAVVADPARLTTRLRDRGVTLLHGDAHTGNLAFGDGTVILFDWSLATAGPPAVEAAWLANFAQQYDFSIDVLLDLWRGIEHDETALGLALLGQAAALIPALCPSVLDFPDPAHRAASRRKLGWWCQQLRTHTQLL